MHATLPAERDRSLGSTADLTALLAAFPDVRFSADVVVAAWDRAVVRRTDRAARRGAFLGLGPTSAPVVFTGINASRIACGTIVEGRSEPDALGLLRQLGAAPTSAAPAATPPAPPRPPAVRGSLNREHPLPTDRAGCEDAAAAPEAGEGRAVEMTERRTRFGKEEL